MQTKKTYDQIHQEMVAKLAKDGSVIQASLDTNKCHLWHMATGVASEAGELLGAFKSHVAYNKELDIYNVIEELGDIEFFLEGIRSSLRLTRNMTLAHNIAKLSRRYPDGYSDASAIERADKEGDQATLNYADEHKNDMPEVDENGIVVRTDESVE